MKTFEKLIADLDLEFTVAETQVLPFEPLPDARDTPRFYLVELGRRSLDVEPLRVIYGLRTYGMPDGAPRLDDVLFYLAVQATQLDRCALDRTRWFETVGIDIDGAAGAALFARQVALNRHVRALLGDIGYDLLVRQYREEVNE